MAKQSFSMHLYAAEEYQSEARGVVQKFKLLPWGQDSNREGVFGAYVGPVTVEAEVPEGFDMRSAKLKALEAEREAVRAEFNKRIVEIQRQINQLTALEMS